MRLHFQADPWDLYVIVGYSVVMSALLLVFNVGNILATLLVLFAPGYVLAAVLFPGSLSSKKSEIDWIERVAISLGLSIAIVPLLGLLLSFTPLAIRFKPIVATIALFTTSMGYAAYMRRMRLPPDRRLSLTLNLRVPEWKEYRALDKGLAIALAGSIVVAGGTLAYVVLTPRPVETFTEFYLLGPGGNASGYPTNLTVNETGSVLLSVVNHESAMVNYTVRVDLVGVRTVYNASSGFNESIELNRTTWSAFDVTLADGQNWTQPYTFQIDATGLWKIQLLLYKDTELTSVYRELHLFVRVG